MAYRRSCMHARNRSEVPRVHDELQKVVLAPCTEICHSENRPSPGIAMPSVSVMEERILCRQMVQEDEQQVDQPWTVMHCCQFEIHPSTAPASSPIQWQQVLFELNEYAFCSVMSTLDIHAAVTRQLTRLHCVLMHKNVTLVTWLLLHKSAKCNYSQICFSSSGGWAFQRSWS